MKKRYRRYGWGGHDNSKATETRHRNHRINCSVRSVKQLLSFRTHMKITPKQYAVLLYEITSDKEKAALSKSVQSFIELLVRNRALTLLPRIERAYQSYYNAREEVLDVSITSARELSHHALKVVKDALSEYNVECRTQIKPEVIGGARIRAGDYMIDDTLQARLTRLTQHLYGNR
ncbi:MAG: ATP synthase F1 subunit delta [bacterium]|nr:ATP synthase F1 subunit delta [bacterium]